MPKPKLIDSKKLIAFRADTNLTSLEIQYLLDNSKGLSFLKSVYSLKNIDSLDDLYNKKKELKMYLENDSKLWDILLKWGVSNIYSLFNDIPKNNDITMNKFFNLIQSTSIPSFIISEKELQCFVYGLLSSIYQKNEIESYYRFENNSIIDFFISNSIGIELKYNPKKADLDRLSGQLIGYKKYCSILITIIVSNTSINYKSPDNSIFVFIKIQHKHELKINASTRSKNYILPCSPNIGE